MKGSDIVQRIKGHMVDAVVEVYSEDSYHFEVCVISEAFSGLSAVNRQRKIYSILNDDIRSGALHAVQLTTLTPAEHKEGING